MFVYQVVSIKNGVENYETLEELLERYEQMGVSNGSWLREELQGQPRLKDLIGGIYNGQREDGKHIIRYETQELYYTYSR